MAALILTVPRRHSSIVAMSVQISPLYTDFHRVFMYYEVCFFLHREDIIEKYLSKTFIHTRATRLSISK